ncbi:MAG: LysM peptidoglycan-binding domain-containing protein [Bacteroidota bacterium]
MRFNRSLFVLILFSIATAVHGQVAAKESNVLLLTQKDSLMLTVSDGKKFVFHPVKPKQTLFSIAKYYSLSLEELYDNNPIYRTDPTLRVGTRIKIPVPNKAIMRYKTKKFVAAKTTPIYYVVQEGDNLYQICKRNFDMPVDTIVKRNKMKSKNIKPFQLIHVGWMGTEGVLPEWRPEKTPTESNTLKTRYDQEKPKHKEVDAQGVCFWQKDSKEKGDLYALHREAAIGTIIAITNPIYRRTVFAKVIGRIPDGYERNIEIILSPEAARKIGAKDPRFFVKLKYLK